jgi:hypothetical protein
MNLSNIGFISILASSVSSPPPAPTSLAEILFTSGDGTDTSGTGNHFTAVGTPSITSGIFSVANAGGFVSDYFKIDSPQAEIIGTGVGQQYVRCKMTIYVPSGAGLIEGYPVSCRTGGGPVTWGMRVFDDGSGNFVQCDMYFSMDGSTFYSTFSDSFTYDAWHEIEGYIDLSDPGNSENATTHIRVDGGSWVDNPTVEPWVPTTSPGIQLGAANAQSYGAYDLDQVIIYDTAP